MVWMARSTSLAARNGDEDLSTVALIVDDEVLLRMMLSDTLADAGFQVVEAASADEALRLFDDHDGTLGVLVTDVQMPGSLDGLALARHTAERWPDVGIVVCSGQVRVEPADLPIGARFVSKPWQAQALLAAVRAVVWKLDGRGLKEQPT